MFSIKITSSNDPNFFRELTLAEKTTIGRQSTCDICLPDPERLISRQHALIEYNHGAYHLTVTSESKPVLINNQPYHHGKSVLLHDGDEIVIRAYVLTMATASVAGANAAKPFEAPSLTFNFDGVQSRPQSRWPEAPAVESFDADSHGLADSITKPIVKPDTRINPLSPDQIDCNMGGLFAGIAPLQANSEASTNLDPLAALGKLRNSQASGLSGAPSVLSNSPFDDWPQPTTSGANVAGKATPLIDLGGHRPAGTKSLEHVHDINLPYSPPPVSEASPPVVTKQPVDDFADFLGNYISKIPSATAQQQPPAQAQQVFSPAPANISSVQTNDAQVLLDAFRKAAGLGNQPVPAEEALAYMESAGTIVRAAIEGITSLLASRSMLKGELGAEDRTMVANHDNNPLKLMPDINDVMQFLFEQKKLNSNAYLAPVQAISGACTDLIYHELGTAAGMRAAVEGSIRRFNPQLIETEFDKTGKKMILNRKACLWETYVEHYNKLELTMADDIGLIFERDFRRAYDQQIRKLKMK